MTLVIVVDPVSELLIHSVHIFHKDHKKRFDTWFTKEQKDRGTIWIGSWSGKNLVPLWIRKMRYRSRLI